MPAYGDIDTAKAGILYGLDNQIEGVWASKLVAGIEFGRPVFGYAGDSTNLYTFKNDVGKIVFDADFVSLNEIIITVNGVDTSTVAFDTDHDTTMDLVLAAINALADVEAVLDADDSNNRTFYILEKGVTAVVAEAITLGASQATGVITYTTAQIFVGMSILTQNDSGLYEQYDAVNVLVKGYAYGDSTTVAAANIAAYVGTDGKFANTGVEIGARFRSNLSSAGLVLVEVEGQKELGVSALFA